MPTYPRYRWDAAGKAHRCEGPDDDNPEWTDAHPGSAGATVMTREEVVEALQEGGIAYSKNAPTAALRRQLADAVRAVLTTNDITFDDADDTKTLLGLLPAPE